MPAFILRQKNNYCDAVIYKKDIMVASLVAQIIHNLPAMQENPDSIPALGRSPEKEMATHSSILAWRIPWTEEPGGLQSMGLQKSQT